MQLCEEFSKEIKTLNHHLSTFNILEACGMANQEIKHSKTLATLLTPNIKGTHVPQKNLNKFILNFIGKDINIGLPLNIEVYCEKYHMDILILNKVEKWVVVIENKIHASQHGNQLERYEKKINTQYPEYKKYFLYLTITDESKFISNPWKNIKHEEVIGLLKKNKTTPNKHPFEMLQQQYIELMEYKILAKINSYKELKEKYEEAIELLFSKGYQDRVREGYAGHIKKILKNKTAFKLTASGINYIRFYYKSWENLNIEGNHDALKNKKGPEKTIPIIFEVVNDKPDNPDSPIYVKLILSTSKSMDQTKRNSAILEIQKALNGLKTSNVKKYGDYTAIWKSRDYFKSSSSKFFSIGYEGVINKWWDDFMEECDRINIEKVVLDVLKKYEK